MTGTTYDGQLGLRVRGRSWSRTQRPPLSLTVLERTDRILVLPSDQSGGLRGGDRQHTEVFVGDQGAVEWKPPTSCLCFPSTHQDGTCEIRTRLKIEPGSRLVWNPPVSIPCRGARIDQAVEISGAPGAELFYWDGWTNGRLASGERGEFKWLKNGLEVVWGGRTVFRERWTRRGGADPAGVDPAGFQGAGQWHLGLAAGLASQALLKERIAAWQSLGESAEWGELDEDLIVARVLVSAARATPSTPRLDRARG